MMMFVSSLVPSIFVEQNFLEDLEVNKAYIGVENEIELKTNRTTINFKLVGIKFTSTPIIIVKAWNRVGFVVAWE